MHLGDVELEQVELARVRLVGIVKEGAQRRVRAAKVRVHELLDVGARLHIYKIYLPPSI